MKVFDVGKKMREISKTVKLFESKWGFLIFFPGLSVVTGGLYA